MTPNLCKCGHDEKSKLKYNLHDDCFLIYNRTKESNLPILAYTTCKDFPKKDCKIIGGYKVKFMRKLLKCLKAKDSIYIYVNKEGLNCCSSNGHFLAPLLWDEDTLKIMNKRQKCQKFTPKGEDD